MTPFLCSCVLTKNLKGYSFKTNITISPDPQRGVPELPGHDGPQVEREDRQQLLPRARWQPGVCVHQAPPDHVRRQLSGRVQRARAGQPGPVPRDGRQPGVGVR